MRKIPLNEFISLRADNRFETARKNFVIELNAVLDSYDKNVLDIDLNDVMECRREMYGLIRELFVSCAAVAVGYILLEICVHQK